MSRPVTLSIDTLSLHGFSPVEARRVEDGFRRELSRLQGDELQDARSKAPFIDLPQGVRAPEHIGAQAARQLIGGIKR